MAIQVDDTGQHSESGVIKWAKFDTDTKKNLPTVEAGRPSYEGDEWFYRIVASTLASAVILAVVGIAVLSGMDLRQSVQPPLVDWPASWLFDGRVSHP